jgi:hypothetical protein
MRITESMIRRIIKEEAKRVINESEADFGNEMDPVGLVERYMIDIEDLFRGDYDRDAAMSEASGMIDDLCENLKYSMHDWLEGLR